MADETVASGGTDPARRPVQAVRPLDKGKRFLYLLSRL